MEWGTWPRTQAGQGQGRPVQIPRTTQGLTQPGGPVESDTARPHHPCQHRSPGRGVSPGEGSVSVHALSSSLHRAPGSQVRVLTVTAQVLRCLRLLTGLGSRQPASVRGQQDTKGALLPGAGHGLRSPKTLPLRGRSQVVTTSEEEPLQVQVLQETQRTLRCRQLLR